MAHRRTILKFNVEICDKKIVDWNEFVGDR
jgi:hypothetical protein